MRRAFGQEAPHALHLLRVITRRHQMQNFPNLLEDSDYKQPGDTVPFHMANEEWIRQVRALDDVAVDYTISTTGLLDAAAESAPLRSLHKPAVAATRGNIVAWSGKVRRAGWVSVDALFRLETFVTAFLCVISASAHGDRADWSSGQLPTRRPVGLSSKFGPG